MNMMRGFLGSYLEGFDPSRRPAWPATRAIAEVVVVADFAVTVLVTTAVMRLAMLTAEAKKSLFLQGPKIHKRDEGDGGEGRSRIGVESGEKLYPFISGESSGSYPVMNLR